MIAIAIIVVEIARDVCAIRDGEMADKAVAFVSR